jgi:predicted ribosome quality control (RQC) complex YloA/Tae2 family protein
VPADLAVASVIETILAASGFGLAQTLDSDDVRGMASKGRPYRTVVVEGYEVLIGKGAEENDVLSLEVAEPHDLWLHVAGGIPGSHVVIRNPEHTAVPKAVVERAAAYAAWYSKARGAPRVEVHTCLARDVSKPRGAPAGRVHIRNFSALKVTPRPVEETPLPDK